MKTIFDRLAAGSEELETPAEETKDAVEVEEGEATPVQHTSKVVKTATQELLKHGLLEADKKPNLYQTALTRQEAINRVLEPLDLALKIDDLRGLAYLVVAQPLFEDGEDEWSHPLIRRQRLTLEQSLLVAMLRQRFIAHEQEAGIGAGAAVMALDELLPQLQVYLGATGSDIRDQKRLRTLLEALKGHGIVSDIDEKEQVTIRPIIAHLANPESLQNLLQHFREQVAKSADPRRSDDGTAT